MDIPVDITFIYWIVSNRWDDELVISAMTECNGVGIFVENI